MNLFKRNVEVIKDMLNEVIKEGDIVVDATMGNGNDTLILSNLVKNNGKVYSFDIQKDAIISTKKLLQDESNYNNYKLILDSHENLEKYINQKVKCVTYNLGYLPNGDESIVTKKDTTIKSLNKAISILEKGGIVTILSYYGHKYGIEEMKEVDEFVKNLNYKQFDVIKLQNYNRLNSPPIMYIIKKR